MTLVITGLDEKGTQEITALAKKLGASVAPQQLEPQSTLSKEDRLAMVRELAGSWQGD